MIIGSRILTSNLIKGELIDICVIQEPVRCMENTIKKEADKKQKEAEFIFNSEVQVRLELMSCTDELKTYLKRNPKSPAVAENMGDKLLFLAKMANTPLDEARKAGNAFLKAADIIAEDASETKTFSKEAYDAVGRNLRKAKESFTLYGGAYGEEFANNIDFRLAPFENGPFKRSPEIALRGYLDLKTPPCPSPAERNLRGLRKA
jgi:hypothetical protein